VNRLGIRQAFEIVTHHLVQRFEQMLVDALIEKLEVAGTVLQYVVEQKLEELLRQIHIVIEIVKRHLRFDHPELGKVAAGIRVFSAERRAEGVDQRQRHRVNLGFQLTAHGEAGLLAEKIFTVIDFPIVLRWIGHIQRRHLKHLPRAFAIARRNNRRVQVQKSSIIEKTVDGICQPVAHAHHRADGVGAGSQMGYFPQILQ